MKYDLVVLVVVVCDVFVVEFVLFGVLYFVVNLVDLFVVEVYL